MPTVPISIVAMDKRKAAEDNAGPPSKKLRTSFTSGPMIVVEVGQQGQTTKFTVHKDLVSATSKFFASATSCRWLPDGNKSVRLPEVMSIHFELYLEWLYNPSGPGLTASARVLDPTIANENTGRQRYTELHFMAEAWLLGDYLGDYSFKNAVMEAILLSNITENSIAADTVATIASRCLPTSGLYMWLVDRLKLTISPTGLDRVARLCPPEFLHEVLKSVLPAYQATVGNSSMPSANQKQKYEEVE